MGWGQEGEILTLQVFCMLNLKKNIYGQGHPNFPAICDILYDLYPPNLHKTFNKNRSSPFGGVRSQTLRHEIFIYQIFLIQYMTQHLLESFDRPLMRVSLSNSIIVILLFYQSHRLMSQLDRNKGIIRMWIRGLNFAQRTIFQAYIYFIC